LSTSIYYKSQKCFDILTELQLMIPDFLDVKIRRFMYPGVWKTRSAVVVRDVLILEDERAAFVWNVGNAVPNVAAWYPISSKSLNYNWLNTNIET
jgi:hypothetical protein